MAIEHWMTFATFGEQEFFTHPSKDTYHGVILNANMVAHAPAGIAAFLMGKVDPGSCFLIDPMTHAFQHNPETISNNKGPKSSIGKLASCYGKFIEDQLGKYPVDPNMVQKNIDEFTKNVIHFQWSFLEKHFWENGDAKYLEKDEVVRRPSIVVAPYFYLTEDNFKDWLPVMVSAAKLSVKSVESFQPSPKVYSALVVDHAILQVKDLREEVHSQISKCGLNGVLLWIDEFDEVTASSLELDGLAELTRSLRESNLEVLNIHGGYFSCLLGSEAFGRRLTGVSHGPEFGESRAVVPVGGGIPISRYYVPDLHLRMKFRDFLPIALNKGWLKDVATFHEAVCNCSECQAVLSGDIANFYLYGDSDVKSIQRKHGVVRIEFPTTEAKKRCLRHYLNNKAREYEVASTLDRKTLLGMLSKAHEKFVGESEQVSSHLQRWNRVLDKL